MKKMNSLIYIFPLIVANCATPPSTEPKNELSVRTTAYTHSESDHIKYGRKTAIGTTLKSGIAATDWSVFPVDTVLLIGGKEYTVEDYGSALVGKEKPVVDIYTPSKRSMRQWGTRHFDDVKVIKWGCWETSKNILKDRLRYHHCRVMYNNIKNKTGT